MPTYKILRSVNVKDLQHDIRSFLPPTKLPENIDEQVNLYNTILQGLLDSHAPKRTRFVTLGHMPLGLMMVYQQPSRKNGAVNNNGGKVVLKYIDKFTNNNALYNIWNLLEDAKAAYHHIIPKIIPKLNRRIPKVTSRPRK